jgi:hypothetical protein
MTYIDLVKKHWPEVSDEVADMILWEMTAFPFASVEHTEKQIIEIRELSGGDIQKACDICMKKTDEAMEEHRRLHVDKT